MAQKKLNPFLKLVLELGPLILFFASYRFSGGETETDRLLFATAIFIPASLIALAISWVLTRHLPKLTVFSTALVLVMGGLTLYLQNDIFIKMKPTILYLSSALILFIGLARNQSYLKYLMDELVPLSDQGWMIFTRRFALFFLALAVANEFIWRSLGTDIWVNIKTFGLPAATFVFMISQAKLFENHKE